MVLRTPWPITRPWSVSPFSMIPRQNAPSISSLARTLSSASGISMQPGTSMTSTMLYPKSSACEVAIFSILFISSKWYIAHTATISDMFITPSSFVQRFQQSSWSLNRFQDSLHLQLACHRLWLIAVFLESNGDQSGLLRHHQS